MLRVGLTGGLGSGKSTVAHMLAAHGAYVLSADDIGRELMQKGQPTFWAILNHFGPDVLTPDAALDRVALARIAFDPDQPGGVRAEELNAIVHPAVIARQAEIIADLATRDRKAIAVVETALLFETKHGGEGGWHTRFDKIILVRATQNQKIERFIRRSFPDRTIAPEFAAEVHAEAHRRLGLQFDDDWKAARSDYVFTNNGSLADLQAQVDSLWPILQSQASSTPADTSPPQSA
jgi:dephospho-CoA kinase